MHVAGYRRIRPNLNACPVRANACKRQCNRDIEIGRKSFRGLARQGSLAIAVLVGLAVAGTIAVQHRRRRAAPNAGG